MATYVEADRLMTVTTPLGADALLMVGLSGEEGLSQLFRFELQLMAENRTEVPFDKLLGQKVSMHLTTPTGGKRHFSGICSRAAQGVQDDVFTGYRLEIVPQFWLLTRRAQSRIFQHLSVPDILKKVLDGLEVTYELQGTFQPRDFCVQYRETDFNFASRLMEEEGIYYFFKHSADGHKMVVANTPQSHPEIPEGSKIVFETVLDAVSNEHRIFEWEKFQELRSGKFTLWDHCFELPHKHLEADKIITDSVTAGAETHKLKVGNNDKLEIYDYPGEYSQRFDGIDRGGAPRPSELQKIFEDNKRTVDLRMQAEAAQGLVVQGRSKCRNLVSGHKFTLERHFNANGPYLLKTIEHQASQTGFRSGEDETFSYQNRFTCMPLGLSYRPPRTTPKPFVQGTQTAVVVGPAGEEIFTDKYSRIKVQFHWDRQGKNDADSSCWVRVGTLWAGKQWGVIHIPRIGQEVIVAFQEGDPDQPIVVGSVYNAETMPPYLLPDNKTQSGVKSRSSLGGAPQHFNEFRFEDKKGEEQLYIHAEKNQDIEVENDETHWVGRDRRKTIDRDERTDVKRDRTETVGRDERINIGQNRTEEVGKNESITIGENRTQSIGKEDSLTVGGTRTTNIGKNEAITVSENRQEQVGKNETVEIGKNRQHTVASNDQLSVGKVLNISAGDQITLTTGAASIVMKKNGDIQISGKNVTIVGSGKVNVKASAKLTLKGSQIAEN